MDDFEREFEVNVHDKLNAGVQIRSQTKKEGDRQNLQVHGIKGDAGPFQVSWRKIRIREK